MDNSIFLLPTMDEELYADEEIDIETFAAISIVEVGWINKVYLIVAGISYELIFVAEYEYNQKKYSLYANSVCFRKAGKHQEAFFIADISEIGRVESEHFFIDIESFFEGSNFR